MSQDDWEHIQSYKQQFIDGSAIASIWIVEDVLCVAKKHRKKVTWDEARTVLEDIMSNLDTPKGISWGSIENCLEEFEDMSIEESEDLDINDLKFSYELAKAGS